MTLRVVLVGLPGVGKTSVGRALAGELGVGFVDLDDVIEARCGASAPDVLRARGETVFRGLEAEALAAALADPLDVVLATGGGTVESTDARTLLMAQPLVVQLVADPPALVTRLRGGDRPLLPSPSLEDLAVLAARRGPWYDEVASAKVDASGPVDEVASAVARLVVRA